MTLSEAIKKIGRPIAFYPWIAKLVGIKAALLLSQVLYWTDRANNERGNGWVYKSVEEMEAETCLTYREQKLIRDALEKESLLECDYERQNHRMWLRVNCEALDKMSDAHRTNCLVPADKMLDGTGQNVSSFNTETTTENTQRDAPQTGAVCTACGLYGIHACKGRPRKHKEPRQRFQKERPYVQEVPKRSSGEGRAEASRRAIEVSCRPGGVAEKALRAAEEGGY